MMKLAVLLVLGAIVAPLLLARPAHADDGGSVGVHVVPVTRGTMALTVTGYGVAAPGPGDEAVLTIGAAGIVETVDVTPGATVHAGTPLLTIAADPAARSAYLQAQAAVANALAARTHVLALLAGHLATKDQLASADQAVADTRAALAALARDGAGEAARVIRAPEAGVVTAIPVQPGARVAAGSVVATVVGSANLVVPVGLDVTDAARVHAGDAAIAAPAAGGPSIAGKVLSIGGMIDSQSGLIDATVALSPGTLPGTLFTVRITTGRVSGFAVPRDAALPDDATGGMAVFQVKNGKALKVPVQVLASNAQSSIVAGGIAPALPIVTEGAYQLDDGTAVRIDPPSGTAP
jgi:RND family efflux transporter MFP subunit